MKRTKTFFAALCMLLTCQAIWAADSNGTIFEYTYSGTKLKYYIISTVDKTCRVHGAWSSSSVGTSTTGSISIPSSAYSGSAYYSVVEVGYCAFKDCSKITSVSLPSTVKKIGDYAFHNCESLSSFNLNNTEEIGFDAFWNCKSLTSFPSGGYYLKEIGSYAFEGCEKMEKVSLPDNVTTLGNYTFSGCI